MRGCHGCQKDNAHDGVIFFGHRSNYWYGLIRHGLPLPAGHGASWDFAIIVCRIMSTLTVMGWQPLCFTIIFHDMP